MGKINYNPNKPLVRNNKNNHSHINNNSLSRKNSLAQIINTINQQINGKGKQRVKKIITSTKTKDCSICCSDDEQDSIKLKCNHVFHKLCFLKWTNYSLNYSCPLCRSDCESILMTHIEPQNTKEYKIYINKFSKKNINLYDTDDKLILNIDINNIHQLLNYNYDYYLEKNYNYNNKTFSTQKILFQIDDFIISHFLRSIILFGPNESNIKVMFHKANDDQFYLDTKDNIIGSFNKRHRQDNYELYEKIYQLLEEKHQIKFDYQHKLHIFDMALYYAGNMNISIFKILRYILNIYMEKVFYISQDIINQSLNDFTDILRYQIPEFEINKFNLYHIVIKERVKNILKGVVNF